MACDIKFTWMQARGCYLCCLKLYDENDRNAQVDHERTPRFKFILLEASEQNGTWRFTPLRENIDNKGNERIYMWEYSDAKRYYLPRYLLSLEAQESDVVYANLQNAVVRSNRMNAAASYAANNAAGLQLVFEDMGDYAAHDYEEYQILPYVYAPDANHVAYADSCGRIHEHTFDVPSPAPDDLSVTPTITETILMPVDADDENAPFAHMTDYNYENRLEDEGRDLQIDLKPTGAVNGATRNFDGFDVVVSDAYLPGLSMRNGDTFAWVRGENIDAVRFSSDGRLRDVISLDERGENLELNFGTEGELSDLDMFRFSMQDFGHLQVFDTEDNAEYDDCIVLRTDGLSNGFGFTFYSDAQESETYSARITKSTPDVWIKLQPFEDVASGQRGVKVWTAENTNDLEHAVFAATPDFVRTLHDTDVTFGGGSASSTPSGGGGEDYREYMPTGGPNGERTANGGLRFSVSADPAKQTGAAVDGVPLQKGVDFTMDENGFTLTSALLISLKDSEHALTVYFTDGRMHTSFVTPLTGMATTGVADVPATGGASYAVQCALALTLTAVWMYRKRRA